MSTDDAPIDPAPLNHLRPVGERELERFQPDTPISVRVRVTGTETPAYDATVLDLSLHGMLITRIPELAQNDPVEILDIETDPIRGKIVRQSDAGTHVAFPSHVQPRYFRARSTEPAPQPPEPKRDDKG